MKLILLLLILITFNSCNLIRLINTSAENNESTEEINSFLSKRKYHYDYSFENIDSTSYLLADSKYRINDSNSRYSLIQLRIYNSDGDFYSGYSQCMGSFNERKIFDSFPPKKNNYPFLNTELKLVNELELINASTETKQKVFEKAKQYDYTFVVYWTIWTNYYSKHIMKEVSKIKKKEPDRVLVIFINTAKDK